MRQQDKCSVANGLPRWDPATDAGIVSAMRPTRLTLVLAVGLLAPGLLAQGCAAAPEAPDGMSDLSRFLIREFDNEDPRVMEAGIANLEASLSVFDLEGPRGDRGFDPDDLTEDDVSAIEHPDVPVDGCVPVGLVGGSPHDVEWFGRYTLVTDQSPAEPSAASYARTFLAPEDPDCFGEDDDCPLLNTSNQIRRANILYTVDFELWKDFRWFDVVADDEPTGRRTLISRSWFKESFEGVNGQNTIVQSFTLDVFIGAEGGGTWRYHVLWSEADLATPVEESVTQGTVRLSIDQHFTAHDEAIAELFAL